jgi:ssDNA-binding Zn-finger/Zn-ribbon topoisomerase 1
MNKNPFKSKIKCKHCGKNYRLKIERGSRKFICGGYHNKNGCKNRVVIQEEFIRDLIKRRYREEEISNDKIVKVVDYIEIESKLMMEIHFTDGSEPILLKGNFLQY